MADFAQMVYGTADNTTKNTGAGFQQSLAQGADLALKQQENQMNQQKLQQAQEQLQGAKYGKLVEAIQKIDVFKDDPVAKKNYTTTLLKYRDSLGIKDIPDDIVQAYAGSPKLRDGMSAEIAKLRDPKVQQSFQQTLANVNDLVYMAKTHGEKIPDTLMEEFRGKADEALNKRLNNETQAAAASNTAGNQRIDNMSSLRKELTQHPTSKDTLAVSASYSKMVQAMKKPSAAGDMTLIYNFMKMQDPGSTVREGEYATAQSAGTAVDANVWRLYNSVKDGTKLTDRQRQDFIQQASNTYGQQVSRQRDLNGEFVKVAQGTGLDPKLILAGTNLEKTIGPKTYKFGAYNMSEDQVRAFMQQHPNEPIVAEMQKAIGGK